MFPLYIATYFAYYIAISQKQLSELEKLIETNQWKWKPQKDYIKVTE